MFLFKTLMEAATDFHVRSFTPMFQNNGVAEFIGG